MSRTAAARTPGEDANPKAKDDTQLDTSHTTGGDSTLADPGLAESKDRVQTAAATNTAGDSSKETVAVPASDLAALMARMEALEKQNVQLMRAQPAAQAPVVQELPTEEEARKLNPTAPVMTKTGWYVPDSDRWSASQKKA